MKEINLRLLSSLAGNEFMPTPHCLSLFVRHVARLPISHAKRQRRGQIDFSNPQKHEFAHTWRINYMATPNFTN